MIQCLTDARFRALAEKRSAYAFDFGFADDFCSSCRPEEMARSLLIRKGGSGSGGHGSEEPRVLQPQNENLRKALILSRELLALADEGDRDRRDDPCGILFGIMRDMGYRLRKLLEEEMERHKKEGTWD